jgi:hypothetical protein
MNKQFSAKWGHKSRTGVVPSLAPARCDMKYYSTPFCCTKERDAGGVIFYATATLTVKIEFALAESEMAISQPLCCSLSLWRDGRAFSFAALIFYFVARMMDHWSSFVKRRRRTQLLFTTAVAIDDPRMAAAGGKNSTASAIQYVSIKNTM